MHRLKILVLLFVLPALPCRAEVFVNQLGYRPGDAKAFVTDEGVTSFEDVRTSDGQPVLAGRTMLRRMADPATGLDLYWGDFSPLTEAGSYRIQLPSGSASFVFGISPQVYAELARETLRSYTLSRCGMALDAAWAGDFARPACHLHDAEFHPQLAQSGQLRTIGGWPCRCPKTAPPWQVGCTTW